MRITLPQNCWNGDTPVAIDLPDEWTTHIADMPGDAFEPLLHTDIRARIESPIGAETLGRIARGKKRIAILFDDISRGTPTQILAETVLELLAEAGVPDSAVMFLCASGMHGAHTRTEFVHKLGERIVRKYPVFNHNPYENTEEIGVTSQGTRVAINAEALRCDMKIGLGCIIPHPFNAFGGGAKIVLPGIAAADSIQANHMLSLGYMQKNGLNPMRFIGMLENDAMRKDIEEAGRMAGLDFIVNVLLNTRREIVDVFAGDPVEAYYAAIPRAVACYQTPRFDSVDICIANANSKISEAGLAKMSAELFTKPGGDIVLVNHCKSGQVPHYLCGPFGLETTMRMFQLPKISAAIRQIIIFNPYPDYASGMYFGAQEQLRWADSWEKVLALLGRGQARTAAVIPDATIQYFA